MKTMRIGDKVKFQCVRCGRCCSTGPNVALTVFDICRIAKYLNIDWRDLRGKYIIAIIADMIPVPALRGLGDKCAFLEINEDGLPHCTIYPARPMRCMLYPFIPLSPSRSDIIGLDTGCLGVGEDVETDPPWDLLRKYYEEVREHYRLLYEYVFEKGYQPIEALEEILDNICERAELSP